MGTGKQPHDASGFVFKVQTWSKPSPQTVNAEPKTFVKPRPELEPSSGLPVKQG